MVLPPMSGHKIQRNCWTIYVTMRERDTWDMIGLTLKREFILFYLMKSLKKSLVFNKYGHEADLGFPESHLQFGSGAFNTQSHGSC